MRGSRRRDSILVIGLSLTLIFGTFGSAYGATAAQKREEAAKAQAAADAAKVKAEDIEAEGHKVMEQIETLEGEIETTKANLVAKQNEVKEQESALDDRLTAMYKTGTVGYVDVILSSEGITDLIQNIGMVQKILQSDQSLLAKLQDEYKEIDKLKKEQETKKAELDQEKLKLDALVEKYKKESASQQAVADQKKAEAAEMEAEARRAAAATKQNSDGTNTASNGTTFTPSTSGGGGYGWPLSGGVITDTYGWRWCPFHGNEFHNGLDIGASSGTPVYAVGDGVVTLASWYGGYGNCIMINVGNGYVTLYGHLSGYNVSAGQRVSKGQVVGYVGSTGNSTGPHLHYTVYHNGSTISPYNL